jgi:hypothetical protein
MELLEQTKFDLFDFKAAFVELLELFTVTLSNVNDQKYIVILVPLRLRAVLDAYHTVRHQDQASQA